MGRLAPLSLGELIEHWTLRDDEAGLVAVKHGDTQLAFALLLRYYGRYGRFPRNRGELHPDAVEFMARAASGPPNESMTAGQGSVVKARCRQARVPAVRCGLSPFAITSTGGTELGALRSLSSRRRYRLFTRVAVRAGFRKHITIPDVRAELAPRCRPCHCLAGPRQTVWTPARYASLWSAAWRSEHQGGRSACLAPSAATRGHDGEVAGFDDSAGLYFPYGRDGELVEGAFDWPPFGERRWRTECRCGRG